MKLLHVDSSINGITSNSRKLSQTIVTEWLNTHPDTQVDYLDLADETPNHLSRHALGFRLPPSNATLSQEQKQENQVSETLVSQFLEADVIVVGVPLYNFSIPSQLKAWIDRLAQAGRTFRYTESGPVGLAGDKTIIVALTRGGVYSNSEAGQAMEHQESYLKTIFGFFGVTDIRIVRAEGTDLGPESRAKAIEQAIMAIGEVVALPLAVEKDIATA
ncbi:FMN-dependent NADH-azoreductase [Pusillimonas sp. ANT_WB101]|uniref:FMN-dependent NADH-azoreductase n=1 Tax=Pusillimonas sp. ANT_WB101 TaxID=2597356 RepID=UPI0011EEF02D|nr:NAD(P)H-dependent oxidoreductase [Pusillimonas sp. ANT_WB101]KAA0911838.1 FMN-dependent NADH-azoreductase [Pusillimonas sp. ANT_WB101]